MVWWSVGVVAVNGYSRVGGVGVGVEGDGIEDLLMVVGYGCEAGVAVVDVDKLVMGC